MASNKGEKKILSQWKLFDLPTIQVGLFFSFIFTFCMSAVQHETFKDKEKLPTRHIFFVALVVVFALCLRGRFFNDVMYYCGCL